MEETIDSAIELRKNFVDEWGMVCQLNKEGGESAYMTALAAILCKLLYIDSEAQRYMIALTKYAYLGEGIFRRHPGTNKDYPPKEGEELWWYADPTTFSRDHAAKTILAFLLFKQDWVISAWFKAMRKRFFFHQNTTHNWNEFPGVKKTPDIMAPGEIINLIRGLNLWFLYPVLCILDIKFLADLYFRKLKPWDYDSLIAVDLMVAKIYMPTPFSELAIYFYKKTDYKERIKNYYCVGSNDIWPIGKLYCKALEVIL